MTNIHSAVRYGKTRYAPIVAITDIRGTIELCRSIPRLRFLRLTTNATQFIRTTNVAKTSRTIARMIRAVVICFLANASYPLEPDDPATISWVPGLRSACERSNEQPEILLPRQFVTAELAQVLGHPLGVQQFESAGTEVFHQMDQGDFGGVGLS